MTHHSGWTFLEILITLAIVALLAAIAFPDLRGFVDHTEDQIVQGELARAIEFAKASAMNRQVPVTLCMHNARDQTLACEAEAGDSAMVFLDETASGVLAPDDAAQLIWVSQQRAQHGQLHWRSFPAYRHSLLFLPSGGLSADNGSFWYCRSHAVMWAIMLSKTGRMRTVYPDQNGRILDTHGKPLTC